MHILLTDVLTCPRCGPDFGLVILADRMEGRRVVRGHLGCPNCRSQYPVRDRVADLRTGPAVSVEPGEAAAHPADGEAAVRLAALLGLAGASGLALLGGPAAVHAAGVRALVPELKVIAVSSAPVAVDEGDAEGVSRVLVSGPALPFRGGLRGAALADGGEDAMREGLRILVPGARLMVDPASAGTADALRGMGAEVLLAEDGVVVARAPGRPVALRYNAVR